jgi:hypothetical protein
MGETTQSPLPMERMMKFASLSEEKRVRVTIIDEALRLYNAAADKFIAKVDNGQARSVETYAELKRARELARKLED